MSTRTRWTDEHIEATLSDIIADLGHFPTRRELADRGLAPLYAAMGRRGGVAHWRDRAQASAAPGLRLQPGRVPTTMLEMEVGLLALLDETQTWPDADALAQHAELSQAIATYGGRGYWERHMQALRAQ